MDVNHYVFVYGTLKKGEPNEHWLIDARNGSAKFIGEAVTTINYPLVIASKYNIPFLLDKPHTGKRVTGEIYEVNEKMLRSLDVLEDYPDWYNRERRPFILHNNPAKTEVTAWVYLLQTYKDSLLELPFLTDYRSRGSHGLVYCEPAMRDDNYDFFADVGRKAGA